MTYYSKPTKKTKSIIALKNNDQTKQTKQSILELLLKNDCKIPSEDLECSIVYTTDRPNNDKILVLLNGSEFKKMIMSITPYL